MLPLAAFLLALDCSGRCLGGVGGALDPGKSGGFVVAAQGTLAAVTATVVEDGSCGPGPGTSCGAAVDLCRFSVDVDAISSSTAIVAISYGSAYPGARWVVLPPGSFHSSQPMALGCGFQSFVWALVFDASTFTILSEEQILLHCTACEKD